MYAIAGGGRSRAVYYGIGRLKTVGDTAVERSAFEDIGLKELADGGAVGCRASSRSGGDARVQKYEGPDITHATAHPTTNTKSSTASQAVCDKIPMFPLPPSPASRTSSRKKPRRSLIDPSNWNNNHLATVGAIVSFGLLLPAGTAPPELLEAVQNTAEPFTDAFSPGFCTTIHLFPIAETSYELNELSATPYHIELRQKCCTELIEQVLCYLCPRYERPYYHFSLRYHDRTVHWRARGYISTRLWVVEPKRRRVDFAEEAAFVLSLAQEFMGSQETEWEVWLVSVRAGKAAVIKATVLGRLLDALQLETMWKVVGLKGGMRMEVGREYRLTDPKQKVEFVQILAGMAPIANALRDTEERYIKAASW
ncbi:hypothetical protein BZA05DRAFT_421742 [Tricharina praecox]|uniref:uncharacterized protein n=1 Tax=Tricharina praecox TaxID=43433 RepID=UPI00221E4034|nr:uncharacterized protein BZA05DRAFT_421742 [Tricharina praecox]KAI5844814.1 hypothetical protein BZA05DRAFT_421742 [Tricharina praecox]